MSLDFIGGLAQSSSDSHTATANRQTQLYLQLMAQGYPITADMAHKLHLPSDFVGKPSSVLPYYLSSEEGKAATAASDTAESIRQMGVNTPADVQKILDQAGEGQNANEMFARDIATGAEGNRMVSEAQPVAQARLDVATGKKNAALEQLQKTINNIDMIQAKKGYTGDSMGNRLLKFNASANIATGAAQDLGEAKLNNSVDKAAIQQQARNMRLGAVALPGQLAQQRAGEAILPEQTAAETSSLSQQPLAFFNRGPHSFSIPQMPNIASPLALGALSASGAGNAASNYFSSQKFRDLVSGSGGGGGGGGGTPNYSGSDFGGSGSSTDMSGEEGVITPG